MPNQISVKLHSILYIPVVFYKVAIRTY